jgi:uncharacterized paraquat-inducible protein A
MTLGKTFDPFDDTTWPVSFCDECHRLVRVRTVVVKGQRQALCARCKAEVTG